MDDFTFDFWLMLGGCFVWNPYLQNVGGTVHRLLDVDTDRLSYYEIRDICYEVGAPISSRYQYLIPGGDLEK